MAIEDLAINYPCPECYREFRVSLHQLLDGGVVVCPRCRATNAVAELEEIDQSLEILGKSLQKIKKSLQANSRLNSQP